MKYTEADRVFRLSEMQELAIQRGGACLSPRYTNTTTKLRWRCAAGHEWEAIPLNVIRNHWCAICGNERQGRAKAHTIEMMRALAKSRGGKCLSLSYKNNLTRLRWRCRTGHEWQAVPGSIVGSGGRKGSWCPICVGKLPKSSALEKLKNIAASRGGSLISNVYLDARTPLQWKCAKGHSWKAVPDAVKRGTWCPVCGGSYPLNLAMMQEYAHKYGGECLSKEYINSKTHLCWRCAEGHEWTAKADHILKGHWCPICSAGVSERICRAILERMTGARFLKVRPSWLRNERGKMMELDGYAPKLKLAFEYQGLQHYQWTGFFHESFSAFRKRQADDVEKRRLCRERGVTLLQVPYFTPHSELQRFLENLLRRLTPNVILNETPIDIIKLRVWHPKDIEELRALAISRDGRVVSNHYINNNTRVRWRCSETHEWEATPASIRRGSWCPKCGDRRAAIKRAHTIDEMINRAAARGGECLSDSYVNSRSRLRWRCAAGHEWETQASVILSGHWCPKCEKIRLGRKYALSLKDIQKTAKERGGECLSESYSNAREKLTWRCARGHAWLANANSVRRGSWCPLCAGKCLRYERMAGMLDAN